MNLQIGRPDKSSSPPSACGSPRFDMAIGRVGLEQSGDQLNCRREAKIELTRTSNSSGWKRPPAHSSICW